MTEFISKKITPITNTLPTVIESDSFNTQNTHTGATTMGVIEKSAFCFLKMSELSQDFVVFARSSQSKMIFIGITLFLLSAVCTFLYVKKILLQ